ncbi:ribonuclease H-like domain-containing protein [Tanacetum coccineum]
MHQPPGFVDSRYPHHVSLLQRSLYSLKQAPRAWFQRFAGHATRAGFYYSRCDFLHVLSYDRKKNALQLLKRAHMVTCNPSRTPVDTESKLGTKGAPVQNPTLYRSLARELQLAALVYCDNVGAVYMSVNPVQHQRTKHIEIDIHFVRDMVTPGQFRVAAGLIWDEGRIDKGLGPMARRSRPMDLESAQNNALAKLSLLKQDHKDGNSFKPVAQTTTNADGTSTSTIPGAVIAEEKIQKKKARFGGNEATKKTQKTLLKQMYENFNASSLESLDSIFTRLQKIIVEQEVKRSVTLSSNSSSQNVAFVSTPGISNEDNTANVQVNTASTNVSTASSIDNNARLSDATIYAFLANQPNGSQVVHEDLKQIHKDDLEEIDLKWQLPLLSLKARKFYQRTGKKIIINGSDTAGYDKSKVECFNCHKMGHFERECRGPRNQESRPRSQDSSRRTVNVEESSSKSMLAIYGVGFDLSYMTEEEIPTNFALMAFSDSEDNAFLNHEERNDNFPNLDKDLVVFTTIKHLVYTERQFPNEFTKDQKVVHEDLPSIFLIISKK